ncbi:MAG TPA: hypothetical protein DD806_06515 [Flavobacterium sp.]|nr:hypothetical protein [Flavobacterium sp.]
MNSVLKLDFFKSLGFPSKEAGIEFIKQQPKLKRAIDEKIDELEETKYQVIETIKEKVFQKFESQKELFLLQVKGKRAEKLAHKKEVQKRMLKEELRAELLQEIKQEEKQEKANKMKKNYPKAYPEIDNELLVKLPDLESLFNAVIKKIDNETLDSDNIVIIEKQKANVERAFELLKKAMLVMEKLDNEE